MTGIFKLLFLPILKFMEYDSYVKTRDRLDNDPYNTIKSDKWKRERGMLK
jgi:hypothetical protein